MTKYRFYFFNILIVAMLIGSAFFMFAVQFKADELSKKIGEIDKKIFSYQEKIQLLEIEWTYLNRPERLRNLSRIYIKNNNYVFAQQIKNFQEFAEYHSSYRNNLAKNQLSDLENSNKQL
jgi:hypothetical protein